VDNAHRPANSLKGERNENKNKKKNAIDGFIDPYDAVNADRCCIDDGTCG
jgi:hypothetical protein